MNILISLWNLYNGMKAVKLFNQFFFFTIEKLKEELFERIVIYFLDFSGNLFIELHEHDIVVSSLEMNRICSVGLMFLSY